MEPNVGKHGIKWVFRAFWSSQRLLHTLTCYYVSYMNIQRRNRKWAKAEQVSLTSVHEWTWTLYMPNISIQADTRTLTALSGRPGSAADEPRQQWPERVLRFPGSEPRHRGRPGSTSASRAPALASRLSQTNEVETQSSIRLCERSERLHNEEHTLKPDWT